MKITVSIDDELAKKVRKIAADKNTTLTAMVRDYLTSLTSTETPALDEATREESVNKLKESWDQLSRPMGPRNWTRDDLYDRPKAFFKRD